MSRYLNLIDRFGSTLNSIDDLGRLNPDALALSREDIEILRALGKKKHEYANLPIMERNRRIWTNTNDLKMTRPPIYVDEICWLEMNPDGELDLHCTHPFARELEDFMRKELYCFEHGLGDVVIEDYVESPLVVYDSGFGIDEVVDIRSTDRNSEVVSRHFHILIEDMDDIQKIHEPEIYLDMERTQQYTELMEEIFKDVIPVKQVGARGLWFTPFDYLIRVLGINETYMNLIEDPDFIEAVVKRYVDCCMVRMRKYRKLGIWASNNSSCRVGSGGYGFASCLDDREKAPDHCDTMQMWGCGNAQIFSEVSPAMHWQFSLQYEMEWLKQFGLNYYGCCEPLWHKMDIMDRIPRLRKVSMSPWNKLEIAAERCRGKYVIDVSHIREDALKYNGQYAILGGEWCPFFHDLLDLLGMEDALTMMYEEPEVVHAILNHLVDYYYECNKRIFDAAADVIDIAFIGNDMGSQNGPLVSVPLFEEFFEPQFKRLCDQAHSYGLHTQMHCCGSLQQLIPSMQACGIDALQSLQPVNEGMDARYLKDNYGSMMIFNGCVDSVNKLIYGTVDDCVEATKYVIDAMKPNGGFILSPSHDYLLEMTPVENVLAMYDTCHEYGVY